ncbi:hypothetical protein [Nocardiopsis sp. NPDC006938]|uniref:hypothetical protein n=1 Tax=Nocardiopsis sp. NPDC006938 TaxID=3364337 RepID=UPI00369210BB
MKNPTTPTTMQRTLAALREIRQLRHEVDVIERDRIAAARAAGAPWEEISRALELKSRQGSRQRHQRLSAAIAAFEDEATATPE